MRLVTRVVLVLVFGVLVALVGAAQAAAASGGPLRPPAPALIERALESGDLDAATGALYLGYALFAPERLPAAYRSPTPFHGTLPLLRAREALERMPAGPQRAAEPPGHRAAPVDAVP